MKEVLVKDIVVLCLTMILPLLLISYMEESLLRFICVCVACELSAFISIYFGGLNHSERAKVVNFLNKKLHTR